MTLDEEDDMNRWEKEESFDLLKQNVEFMSLSLVPVSSDESTNVS